MTNLNYDEINRIAIVVNQQTDWLDRKVARACGILCAKLSDDEYTMATEAQRGALENLIPIAEEYITNEEREALDEAIEYYSSTSFVFRNFFGTLGDYIKNDDLRNLISNIGE